MPHVQMIYISEQEYVLIRLC